MRWRWLRENCCWVVGEDRSANVKVVSTHVKELTRTWPRLRLRDYGWETGHEQVRSRATDQYTSSSSSYFSEYSLEISRADGYFLDDTRLGFTSRMAGMMNPPMQQSCDPMIAIH